MELKANIVKLPSMVRQAVCIFICLITPCIFMAIVEENDSLKGDAFISVYGNSPVTSIVLWLLVAGFVALFVTNVKIDKLLFRSLFIGTCGAVYAMIIVNNFVAIGSVSLEAALSCLGLTLIATIYSITISLFEFFRNKPYFD